VEKCEEADSEARVLGYWWCFRDLGDRLLWETQHILIPEIYLPPVAPPLNSSPDEGREYTNTSPTWLSPTTGTYESPGGYGVPKDDPARQNPPKREINGETFAPF
jgi:hypothetical protein